MHVVDVCAFYTPHGGGVKTYVDRKVKAAARHGVKVTVLAPGKPGHDEAFGLAGIRSVPGRRFPLDGRYCYFHDEKALHAALDDLSPDFVEASSPWSSAAMVARWPGAAPRALVMHADPLSTYAYRWFDGVFRRETIDRRLSRFWGHLRCLDDSFDLVVCAGRELTRRLQLGGLRQARTIPMGVEPGVFSPDLRDEDLRQDLLRQCSLPPSATLLLGVGRLAAEKRWPMVVDAVMAAGIDHPLGLVLIGDGRDRAAVLARIGNNPHVRLLGPVVDRVALARIMASSDALVHGCESETFCMVASEARASGLPLIVPDRGGGAEQAEGGAGFIYASGRPDSLAQTIRACMANDAGTLRLKTTTLAPSVRSMDDHFAELFRTYSGLIARNAGPRIVRRKA
ncbi:glycosyltransferase [Novosphingobium sp. Gsoil 351]|uniref:glycosyltransferase n=1 Tax=Novosphingobium sp. Gsoil 351 TaxID=2675225 RepID=UPI0012B45AD9|nr:glycosyltransferase [Novosphingobium sp. Gsoil 351]QGN55815.1 glycosyltransferase [Novosphingobium sp. Gsoil 351]